MERKHAWAVPATAAGAATLLCTAQAARHRHDADMTDGTGKTVLITGASGDIGRELAFVFAEHHFRIAAFVRSEEKLQELKQELENSYGVEVEAVQKDLTDKDTPHELYEEMQMAGSASTSSLTMPVSAGRTGWSTPTPRPSKTLFSST